MKVLAEIDREMMAEEIVSIVRGLSDVEFMGLLWWLWDKNPLLVPGSISPEELGGGVVDKIYEMNLDQLQEVQEAIEACLENECRITARQPSREGFCEDGMGVTIDKSSVIILFCVAAGFILLAAILILRILLKI